MKFHAGVRVDMRLTWRHAAIAILLLQLAFAESNAADPGVPGSVAVDSGIVFHIAPDVKQTTITFHSRAPLEDFSGTTSQVSGYLTFDPAHPGRGGVASICVPVATLNTGIPLRDEHLRSEDWLDASQYPEVVLRIAAVDSVTETDSKAPSRTYQVTVRGLLTLHGVEKPINLGAVMTFLPESEATRKKLPGDWLAVRTEFPIALTDFGIGGPARTDIVGTRVSDTVVIQVSLLATSKLPTAGEPPAQR